MSAPLAMAPEGSYVEVEEVRAGYGMARRLAEMGLVKGARLRVVKAGPGPVIVELLGGNGAPSWRLALSLGMAMKVYVRWAH